MAILLNLNLQKIKKGEIMFGIGFNEILIILIIALLIIGPKKLPEIAKALGKGYREFRKSFEDLEKEFNIDEDDEHEKFDEVKVVGKKKLEDKEEKDDRKEKTK